MKNRLFVVMILSLTLLFSMLTNVKEVYAKVETYESFSQNKKDVAMRGDIIVTKYRLHNGHSQYRHWNVTRNCWVESDWIDI